jgi:hypothetical protein
MTAIVRLTIVPDILPLDAMNNGGQRPTSHLDPDTKQYKRRHPETAWSAHNDPNSPTVFPGHIFPNNQNSM